MEQREKDALDAHITGNYGEDSVERENTVRIVPRVTLGVTIEKHSKGTNWSVKVDGASSVTEVMLYANELRHQLEKQYGSVAEVR